MRKLIIILAVVIAAVFTSCGEFLDEMPDNRTKIDNMDKVQALLVTAYPSRTFASCLESRCDGIIDHGSTMDGTQPGASFDFVYTGFRWDEHPSFESDESSDAYWRACYAAIAVANHALEAIENLGTPAGSEPYVAEAKLSRAYGHFTLLTLFSNFFDETNRGSNPGIPYVTEPEEVINKQYERGTVASTLEQVKADLADGLKNAGSSGDFDEPKFHFALNSARMLALRIALFERDYPSVISYASMLIPQPTDLVTLSGKNADNTARVAPSTSDAAFVYCGNNLFDWNGTIGSVSGSSNTELAFSKASNANIVLASEPYSLLGRLAGSTAYSRYAHASKVFDAITGINATGANWHLPVYSYNIAPPDAPGFVPKIYEDLKVTNINANTGQPYCRVALFRLEEAILARAEAYAMMGEYDKALVDLTMYVQNRLQSTSLNEYALTRDKVVEYYTGALSLDTNYMNSSFNASRFSSNVDTYEGKLQRALVMTVLDARRTEYLYEGMRWFDILRWNIPVTHTMNTGETSTLTPDDDRRVLQLPETVTLSGLKMNPFDNIPNPWN